ncbi:MAG TPA: pectinesterase family protein [Tepidisphaeraceae bacterium]|nr:pectinesterase family protein [Tepidisphaeraceae bacterium]
MRHHRIIILVLAFSASTLAATKRVAQSAFPSTLPSEITVAADGSGMFKTVQEAVDAIPGYPHHSYQIHVLPGIYTQQVTVPRLKSSISIWGDDPATTVLTFDLGATMLGADHKAIGTFATPSVRILADDFTAKNITFQNTFGPHGQALAIEIAGDRVAFDNCRFLGWQDTVFADSDGRNYFHNCYIEGHVDFIFGKSTAVFDSCEIHSKAKGYLTASSTEKGTRWGYVFLHCKLTADKGVPDGSVYLGRPWRPFGATAFIDCRMGPHIRPKGWFNWKNPANEKTARYAEYGSTGPGASASTRVSWAKQLSQREAAGYTVLDILAGWEGWVPPFYQGAATTPPRP